MKNRNEIETEKNFPFMAKVFKKELPQIREWLKTCPCGYEEILLKSGELCVAFDLEDLYEEQPNTKAGKIIPPDYS